MATSTEQINDLIAGYTTLKEYFEGAKGGIEAALTVAATKYTAFFSGVYMDAAIGDDGNNGTQENPVASLQRAVQLLPLDGFNTVYMRGDYTTPERITTQGRALSIIGCEAGEEWVTANDPANRPKLTFGYYALNGAAEVAGFHNDYDAFIDLSFLTIQLPSLAIVQAGVPGMNTGSVPPRSVFAVRSSGRGRAGCVYLRYSELIVPADYYGQLFDNEVGWTFSTKSVTITGNIGGKVANGIASGTPAADVAHRIQTNLATL